MLMRSADRHRPPTIYDVAETAGVSHTTVSRAVNGEGGMTEETRRRVLEVVARVGYEPNTAARVLAGRIRPRLAAVVEEGAWSPQTAHMLGSVARAAQRRGYALTIVGVDPSDPRSRSDAADRLGEPGIAGAVLLMADVPPHEQLGEAPSSSPRVSLSATASGAVGSVGADPVTAAELAVDHLLRLGHRSIGYVVAEGEGSTTATRFDPVGAALAARGLSSGEPVHTRSTAQAGFRLGRDEGALTGCTALIAPTASFALGAVRGLRERGIRVPADVSIVSLEDHVDAAHYPPPLTAVSTPVDELAQLAVSILLRAAGDAQSEPDPVPRTRLVVRATTGPPVTGHRHRAAS